jgi:hypothetical protein
MRLLMARVAIGCVAAAIVAAGLFVRWQTGNAVDRHRERVLDQCSLALAALKPDVAPAALARDLSENWEWGSYDFPSRLVADRLNHDTERFPAIRISRHERLPGGEPRCRLTWCVYSIPLDRSAVTATEGRCGGGGATEMVTPTLKPDIMKLR